MKFSKLYLKAFGPYTERLIDFESSPGSLHIVYGLNEAGKSSMLRAIRALLYGIEEKTRDNFLHENSTLRIGGVLVAEGHRRLAIMRRKGRKSTVREWNGTTGPDCEGSVIDDSTLSEFLGGLDKEQFGLLFGIDRDELIRGGNEILEGEGEVGESLFEAGAGLVGLRKLRGALEAEAAALFAPKASKPVINEAVSTYEEARAVVRQTAVRTEEWTGRDEALRAARDALEQNGTTLTERRLQRERLGRISRNLGPIAQREECTKQLVELAGTPDLPHDFAERRVAVVTARADAERRKSDAEKKVADFEAQLEGLVVPAGFVERAALIQEVQSRVGAFQKAGLELPGVEAQVRSSQERLVAKCRELGVTPDLQEIEKLRPKKADQAKVRGLIKEHADLTGRLSELVRQETDLQTQLEQAEKEFDERGRPKDAGALVEAIETAAALGDAERRFGESRRDIASGKEDLERKLRALWQGPVAALRDLRVPSKATLERLLKEAEAIATERAAIVARAGNLRGDQANLQAKKVTLEASGSVASGHDLEAARKHRDLGWEFIRRAFIDRKAKPDQLGKQYGSVVPLPEAYQAAVRHTDSIADTLRHDAHRIAEHAGTVERIAQIAGAMSEHEKALAELAARDEKWQEEWNGLIGSLRIGVKTVREVEEWLQERERVVARFTEIEKKETEAEGIEKAIQDVRGRLESALTGVGISLDPKSTYSAVLAKAKGVRAGLDKETADYEQAKKNIMKLRTNLASHKKRGEGLSGELAGWRSRWITAITPLGLGAQSEPTEAEDRGRLLEELFEVVDELRRLQGTVEVHSAALSTFAKEVCELAAALGVEAGTKSTTEVVTAIVTQYEHAVRTVHDRDRVSNLLESETSLLGEAVSELRRRDEEVQELCRLASVSDVSRLQEVEARAMRKRELLTELRQVERQLLEQNSMTLDNIVEEAASVDRDTLQVQIAALDQEMKELDSDRVILAQRMRDAEVALNEVDGGSRSAEAAQRAQDVLAKIKSAVEDYAQLKLSSFVIAKSIEAYRQKHQGPILKRAGEYFATLTCDKFRGLEVDFDENDRQVLVGIRNDAAGRRVKVQGMSDGTRDQLYVALRLAAIERHLESGKAIPLIVDDVLVQFDDDRAAAALKALAMMATKTQVLLFTHHGHLLPLAKQVSPEGLLAVHTIEYPLAA